MTNFDRETQERIKAATDVRVRARIWIAAVVRTSEHMERQRDPRIGVADELAAVEEILADLERPPPNHITNPSHMGLAKTIGCNRHPDCSRAPRGQLCCFDPLCNMPDCQAGR